MILLWQQLPLHFGNNLISHSAHFARAHQTTYGILCCRFTPSNDRLDSSSGDHAEARLLRSPLWQTELPQALSSHSILQHTHPLVVMAINRSPCPNCTHLLYQALRELQWRYAARFQRSRFILASLGVYEGRAGATTDQNLAQLHDAGWELAVLQSGSSLTRNGQQLLQGIQRVTGVGQVRPLRLES